MIRDVISAGASSLFLLAYSLDMLKVWDITFHVILSRWQEVTVFVGRVCLCCFFCFLYGQKSVLRVLENVWVACFWHKAGELHFIIQLWLAEMAWWFLSEVHYLTTDHLTTSRHFPVSVERVLICRRKSHIYDCNSSDRRAALCLAKTSV